MRWIPAFILFVAAAIVLYIFGEAINADKYGPVLITANVAMAIFAINFAFSAYQNSDYKQFHRTISSPQIYAFLAVLLLAMSPLFAAAVAAEKMARLGVAAFPLVAFSSVVLLVLAKKETSPLTLLKRRASSCHVRKFTLSFFREADMRLVELQDFALTGAADMPTHEWSWHVPPNIRSDDPFNVIAGIALVAVNKNDAYAFQLALETAFARTDEATALTPQKTRVEEYKVQKALGDHLSGIMLSMCKGIIACDHSGLFLNKFLDVGALYLAKKAADGKQTSARSLQILSLMKMVAKSCLSLGQPDSALVPIILARQIVQKGIDYPPSFPDDNEQVERAMFDHTLSQIPYMMVELGSSAIALGNSDFLYRCFDAFGWLGCSAIKLNNLLVGRICLRALAQLGREARAANLECFWDHCALTPTDHAEERIGWILSWLPSVPDDDRSKWSESIEEAYSRITGRETEIKPSTEGSKFRYSIAVSQRPHQMGYSTNGMGRVLDYSDLNMLKDSELY